MAERQWSSVCSCIARSNTLPSPRIHTTLATRTQTNVRMQSEAPPADFDPMAAPPEEGLSAGQKAGVAVGVIGGAAVIGAVGFFAFKGFGAAAAATV